jgi:uncharacterized protein (TIGR00290 family)
LKKKKAIFSWSGGKDSTICLHSVLLENVYEICYLLTTINGSTNKVSMHGVHESLIAAQAESIGIPLILVKVYEDNNSHYEMQMQSVLSRAKSEGIETVIFGDIFLEDLKKYREDNLAKVDMHALFPLWNKNTGQLVQDFMRLEYKSIICCVNNAYLGKIETGVIITNEYINELPLDVDPCGENGEYHSFCFSGPIFKKPIRIKVEEIYFEPLSAKYQVPDKNNKVTTGYWFAKIQLE